MAKYKWRVRLLAEFFPKVYSPIEDEKVQGTEHRGIHRVHAYACECVCMHACAGG